MKRKTHDMKPKYILIIFIVTILIQGCTSPRMKKFQVFAKAGSISAKANQTVYSEAAALAAETDTYTLIKQRDSLPTPKERAIRINRHNKEVTERVKVLQDLEKHSALLDKYFLMLSKLAGSDAPSNSGEKISAIVSDIQSTGSAIRGSSISSQKVADFIGKAAEYTLSRYQVKALDKEFRLRGSVIARELELQTAALKAVKSMMEVDIKGLKGGRTSIDVVKPYSSAAALPKDWNATRTEVLTGGRSIATANAAIEASTDLNKNYVRLLENKLSTADLELIANDLNTAIATLKEGE